MSLPENFEFVSVVERVWRTEEAIVYIGDNSENQNFLSYHDIDKKPLFAGANNEYENDSLIFDFLIYYGYTCSTFNFSFGF